MVDTTSLLEPIATGGNSTDTPMDTSRMFTTRTYSVFGLVKMLKAKELHNGKHTTVSTRSGTSFIAIRHQSHQLKV
jgi:hypothetical protein